MGRYGKTICVAFVVIVALAYMAAMATSEAGATAENVCITIAGESGAGADSAFMKAIGCDDGQNPGYYVMLEGRCAMEMREAYLERFIFTDTSMIMRVLDVYAITVGCHMWEDGSVTEAAD